MYLIAHFKRLNSVVATFTSAKMFFASCKYDILMIKVFKTQNFIDVVYLGEWFQENL